MSRDLIDQMFQPEPEEELIFFSMVFVVAHVSAPYNIDVLTQAQ